MKMGLLGNQARTKKSMTNYELLLSSVLVVLVIIVEGNRLKLLSILSLILARPTRLGWLQESKKIYLLRRRQQIDWRVETVEINRLDAIFCSNVCKMFLQLGFCGMTVCNERLLYFFSKLINLHLSHELSKIKTSIVFGSVLVNQQFKFFFELATIFILIHKILNTLKDLHSP